ncbi:MAG: DNA-protecting protein DprA [Planctomycetes bacterium]|nr:DNA-protecting protein DprA [Planctomycetota bacterium]
MKYLEKAINVLAAKTYKGIGRAWIVKNMRGNESVDVIVSLLNKSLGMDNQIARDDFEMKREIIRQEIQKLRGFADGVVAIGDEDFPRYRGNVKNSDQPIAIFYRGELDLLKIGNKNIAVIGLLDPGCDTETIEKEVVAEFIKRGVTIVGGLALGCDSIAHRQALLSSGKTIAVLPGPLNNILPKANVNLANEIVEKGGLLISEYYRDAISKMELRGRYQERDRLQALFSDCVVLSASYAKNDHGLDSGSRLAMEFAMKYSIHRAVLYDPIANANSPEHELNRQIIKDDEDVITVNRNNLHHSISKVVASHFAASKSLKYQKELFDIVQPI